MVPMAVRRKYIQRLWDRGNWNVSLIIVEEPETILPLQQKTTVSDVGYFHEEAPFFLFFLRLRRFLERCILKIKVTI